LVADAEEGRAAETVPQLSQRFLAPGLLCLGSVSAMCAFVGTFSVSLMEFFTIHESDILNIRYPSGNGYWPETVSESVSNRESPTGKIFFTGCLIAGILYFLSWYPYSLRNVYTGPELFPGGVLYWTTFRQYFPLLDC